MSEFNIELIYVTDFNDIPISLSTISLEIDTKYDRDGYIV